MFGDPGKLADMRRAAGERARAFDVGVAETALVAAVDGVLHQTGHARLISQEDNTLRQSGPIYLHGCGQSCPDGWINFDASPTLRLQRLPVIGRLFKRGATVFPASVRFGDIVQGLPIADEFLVEGIYASHVLEHLSYADFWTALERTFRLLRPGGIFRLVVPDLKGRAQKYIERLELGKPRPICGSCARAAGIGKRVPWTGGAGARLDRPLRPSVDVGRKFPCRRPR